MKKTNKEDKNKKRKNLFKKLEEAHIIGLEKLAKEMKKGGIR